MITQITRSYDETAFNRVYQALHLSGSSGLNPGYTRTLNTRQPLSKVPQHRELALIAEGYSNARTV